MFGPGSRQLVFTRQLQRLRHSIELCRSRPLRALITSEGQISALIWGER